MINIRKHLDYDTKASNVIVLHIYLLICKNMLVNVNDFAYQYNGQLNTIITVLFAVLYLDLLLSGLMSRIKVKTFVILLLAFSFIAVTFIIDAKRFTSDVFPYSYVKTQMRTFFAYCFPLFIAVSSLKSVDLLLKKLYDATFVPFVCASFTFVLSLLPHENGVYMAYGNAVLTVSLLLLFKYYHTRLPHHMIQFLLTCVYILISGSRGPIVSLIIAVALVLYVMPEKKNIPLVAFSCVALIVCVLFYNQILAFFIQMLDGMNVSSRTLRMLLSGNLTNDSNRGQYHMQLLSRLYEHPIIGLGAFGGEAAVGLAHSWYLDVLANFGFIGGALFIGYIIFKDIHIIIKNNKTAVAELLLILSIFLFPRGFFDDNFWGSKEMWMILALFAQVSSGAQYDVFVYSSTKRVRIKGV